MDIDLKDYFDDGRDVSLQAEPGYYRAMVFCVEYYNYAAGKWRCLILWEILSHPDKIVHYVAIGYILRTDQRGFRMKFQGWPDQDVEGSLIWQANSGPDDLLYHLIGLEADVIVTREQDQWGRVQHLVRLAYPAGTKVEKLPNGEYRMIADDNERQ